MKTIVISGINLFEGGPLSIYYDLLDTIVENDIYNKYSIVIFVHKKELFKQYNNFVTIIELPLARKNYLNRLYYEYVYFYKYSKKRDIDIWISLHDITPRVVAKKQYTYCHNPSPFMKKDISKIKYSIKNVMFSFFYKYLYRINIKSACAIIVQQNWIRKEFLEMYPVKSVVVARPNFEIDYTFEKIDKLNKKKIFIFPAYPRFFKNYEVICEAVKLLDNYDFEVLFTLDGSENQYSKDVYKKYGTLKQIKWLGLLDRNHVFELYNKSDCLIFPSQLETWGLPISEYKLTGKPIILSDLPYAYETLGCYEKCNFFDPTNSKELAKYMENIILEKDIYNPQYSEKFDEPFFECWEDLLDYIFKI